MRQGNLVEYLEDGQIFLGFVLVIETSGSGSKTRETYRILNEKNKTLSISPNKIINSGQSGFLEKADHSAIAEKLVKIRDIRRELTLAVPLSDIWELSKLEQTTVWTPKDLAEAYYGKELSSDQLAAVARALHTKNPYFKRKEDYFYAVSDEDLQKYNQQLKHDQERLERESVFFNSLSELMASNFAKDRISEFLEKFGDRVELLKNSFIFPETNNNAVRAKELQTRISEGLNIKFDPFNFLVGLGIFTKNENFLLKKYGVRKEFDRKILDEVSALKKAFSIDNYVKVPAVEVLNKIAAGEKLNFEENCRADFRDIATYTIDSAETTCCDDGLSFFKLGDGYALLVHVADISEFVRDASEIDREAFSRATAIYMAEGKIDIFPGEISSDLFSLKEGEPRLSLTLAVVLSENLETKGFWFLPSIIRVEKKCTYDGINTLAADTASVEGALSMGEDNFKKLFELAGILKADREKAGAMSLFFPKADIYVEDTPDGPEKIKVSTDDHGASGQLVSETMVLYNSMAARFLNENGGGGLYKYSNAYPEPALVAEYKKSLEAFGYNAFRAWEIRRLMPYSIASYEMLPHKMLGVPGYVQASSPLRRYTDLLMQRQIKNVVFFSAPLYDAPALKEKILYCESPLSAASEIEQESSGYWLYKYLKLYATEPIRATVIEATDERFRLELEKYYLHLFAHTRLHGRFEAGEKVMVTIEGVDVRERKIRFTVSRVMAEERGNERTENSE